MLWYLVSCSHSHSSKHNHEIRPTTSTVYVRHVSFVFSATFQTVPNRRSEDNTKASPRHHIPHCNSCRDQRGASQMSLWRHLEMLMSKPSCQMTNSLQFCRQDVLRILLSRQRCQEAFLHWTIQSTNRISISAGDTRQFSALIYSYIHLFICLNLFVSLFVCLSIYLFMVCHQFFSFVRSIEHTDY